MKIEEKDRKLKIVKLIKHTWKKIHKNFQSFRPFITLGILEGFTA